MTKRWKLKTNSSNILLVLITLILVKAEWIKEKDNDFQEDINSVESNSVQHENGQTHIYVGNDEIAEYFFHYSINNNSFILEEMNKCLDSFQLITCAKMLLLNKINDVVNLMKEKNTFQKNVSLLDGLLVLKMENEDISSVTEESEYLSLDEEISAKVKRIFQKRSLLVNLLPKIKIELQLAVPETNSDGLICFNYTIHRELESEVRNKNGEIEGRKKKGGGMSMMMLVPQLIMLGLMPFTLASLKAMVMNAVMINMMALNGAIFMTIRNLVFGPRRGDNVKYVNYGYSKDRQTQSPKPVLIIHSPAAFVKQPPVHKKRVHGHSPTHQFSQNYFPQSHHSNGGYSHPYHHQNVEIIEDNDIIAKQNQNQQIERRRATQERNGSEHFNSIYKLSTTENVERIQNDNININLTPSNQKNYKSEVRMHEKNQKQKTHHQNPSIQFHEKLNSKFVYSNKHEKGKSQTFRQSSGSEFKPSPQWHAVTAENIQNLLNNLKN